MNDKSDVVKSNALIEAAYHPGNVYQMRLLLACLMQVRSVDELSHKNNFVVTANALADLTGDKAMNNYRELRKAAESIRSMFITIKEKPNGEIGSPDRTEINVTGSCRYYENEGKVSLRFNAEIIPYISSLKKRFTQYQAKYVMPMRSSYGIRLYELCLQWLGDEREFEVEEFKQMFGLGKKYIDRIDRLKDKVIKPALQDINKYSDIQVKFGQRKSGRKVTHFQFAISRKQKLPNISLDQYVEQHADPGEDWGAARKRLKQSYEAIKYG